MGRSSASDCSGILGAADDYPGPGTGEVVIEVESGDSSSAIGATLADADVVASADAFVDAAVADERALGIQPGFFAMSEQMSARGRPRTTARPGRTSSDRGGDPRGAAGWTRP